MQVSVPKTRLCDLIKEGHSRNHQRSLTARGSRHWRLSGKETTILTLILERRLIPQPGSCFEASAIAFGVRDIKRLKFHVRPIMRLPVVRGVIDRRILVNYRVDPSVIAPLLPPPFRPKLVRGMALVGICLIRLKQLRPAFLPAW